MYVKLFTSLYQGTLRGKAHEILVFTNLLAHADKDGIVDMHPRAIADEVGLSVDEVRNALTALEAPDDESRTPDEGGRRIIRMDDHRAWGWRVVNYRKYREIKNEQDRREQNRLAQERTRSARAGKKADMLTVSIGQHRSASVSTGQRRSAQSAHAEAEAYTEEKNQEQKSMPPLASKPDARGTRLPDDWQPSQELIDYARAKRPTMNIANEVEAFRDYWHAKAGAGARKVDWSLTFKTWIRSAYNKPPTQTVQQLGGSRAAGRML